MARLREIVAAILTACLLMTPVWGAPAGALGTVVAADRASVGGAQAPVGTTIFAGDRVSTADAGSIQLRTAAARLLLSESSMVTVSENGGTPEAMLLNGTATFSTANAKAFLLNASSASIRAKSDEPTIGQVSILGRKQLLVKCMRGALTVTVGDDSRVVPEGASYRIVLEPSAEEAQNQPPAQGSGSKGSGRPPLVAGTSKFVWYAVGAVGIITFLAVQEAWESPDRP